MESTQKEKEKKEAFLGGEREDNLESLNIVYQVFAFWICNGL